MHKKLTCQKSVLIYHGKKKGEEVFLLKLILKNLFKKTLSVRPKNTPGHHKGNPQALPSYMRPTSSSTTKQNAAIFKRPQTAKKLNRQKKVEKENVQPRTPEQPWPDVRKEKDLSFKSALRAEKKREKITRRRTRVMPTMRSLELDFDKFIDIIDTEKNWGKLSKSDRDAFRVKKVQETIKSLIDELESLNLPNEDLSEALKDLAESYPKVKLEKFSHYWRLRVSNAIRCGQSKSDVFDLISAARKANAEPKIVIDEIYASTFEVYKNDPDLRKGTKQPDHEMTIILNEEQPEEHDQLELSIDFSPSKAESTLIRSSPKKMVRPKFNSMIEEVTENSTAFEPVDLNSFMLNPKSQGSFYKLKKIKVNRDSKVSLFNIFKMCYDRGGYKIWQVSSG